MDLCTCIQIWKLVSCWTFYLSFGMKKLLMGIAFVATLMLEGISSQRVWNGALTGWGVFRQQTNNLISQQSSHIAIKLKTCVCCKNCGPQMCLLACCNYNHGHSSLSYYCWSVLLRISGLLGLSFDACGGRWPLSPCKCLYLQSKRCSSAGTEVLYHQLRGVGCSASDNKYFKPLEPIVG